MKSLLRRIKTRWPKDGYIHPTRSLLSVPELRGRISAGAHGRHGPEALSYQAIAETLVQSVQYVAGAAVEGDLAEFGCMSGRTARALAAAMGAFRFARSLHLFDSFEGLPESTMAVDKASFHVRDGVWGKGTCRGITPESLRKMCRSYLSDERIRIYHGWFCETVKSIPPGTRFGLVHIDGDLYQSAVDVMNYLFGRGVVAEGAVFLFDDWNCNRASNRFGERRAWADMVAKYGIEFSDASGYACFGQRFFVHSYTGLPASEP